MVPMLKILQRFNTVNGKHCCNFQAKMILDVFKNLRFNTVNGKHCCNVLHVKSRSYLQSFNTVNGKHCCNNKKQEIIYLKDSMFQYRKR